MKVPTIELTYEIEWDEQGIRIPNTAVRRVILERLGHVARDGDVEIASDGLVTVRLANPSLPDLRAAKVILGFSGLGVRPTAPLHLQESYLRTGRIPQGYDVWKNALPMDADHAAYRDSVLLEHPPTLTAQFLTGVRSWADSTGEHGGGGVLLIDFDRTGQLVLDSLARELSERDPPGLLGVTVGKTLAWLSFLPTDRSPPRLLLTLPEEREARRLAGLLSSGYLPARLGGRFEGQFEAGRPVSERSLGPPLDLQRPGREIAERYASLSYAYGAIAEFSAHGVIEEGLAAIERAMREHQRDRAVDRALLDGIRWLATLFGDPSLRLPLGRPAIAVSDKRDALAVISGAVVRVLSTPTATWSEGIPLSGPLQGIGFIAPDRLAVRTASDDRKVTLGGRTLQVRVVEQHGPVSVRVAECLDPGPILGTSPDARFLVYRTEEKSGVGIVDLDSVPEGTHSAPLRPLTLREPHTYPTWARVSPLGGRMLIRTYDPESLGGKSYHRKPLFQLVDTRADDILGTIKGAAENHYTFSWSPNGRWMACHEEEQALADWDVPVGSSLRSYVRLYDGLTAQKKWSHQASNRGDFGWTEDGLVRCEGKLWDAESGEVVKD